MNRFARPFGLLATLLAVLLPLEQAHCMWMSAAPEAQVPACHAKTASAPHACCLPGGPGCPARAPDPAPTGSADCPCFSLPSAAVPAALVAPALTSLPAPAPAATGTAVVAPQRAIAFAPRLDIGPAPPARFAVAAHGLRAPPLLG